MTDNSHQAISARPITREPVRVLCAANAAYAGPLCVMLVSLVMNFAQNRKIEIYVFGTNIPQEDRRKIEASLCRNRPGFDPASIHWLSPDLGALEGLYVQDWSGIEVFARLLAPRVLPEYFEKILYLDADMVVLDDVSPLYDSELEGSVHAVRDEAVGFVSEPHGVFNYAELTIPPRTPYFNSGVLLINLRYWREHNVAGRVLDYLRRYHDSVSNWDQGGLNAILYDSWVEIDPAWNQIHYIVFPYRWKELGRSMVLWRRTKNHPKIVHFTSREKPWISDERPRYSYFFKYLAKTEYRHAFKGALLEQVIGFRLHYILLRVKTVLTWKRSPRDILRLLKSLPSRIASSGKH